jgi:predicted CXXCH cytochrome family protein
MPQQVSACPKTRLLVALALALAATGTGSAGDFDRTRHGDPQSGVSRNASMRPGSCSQCHDMHATRNGEKTGAPAHSHALFAANDNALCATCHKGTGALGIFPGMGPWESSAHARSPRALWPGPPARPGGDAGKCLNCHDPHGRSDRDGLIPAMARVRGDGLCMACHDGSPASTDVQRQMQKPYGHGTPARSGRHDEAEASNPSRFGTGNRHAECVDCHSPHRGREGKGRDAAPDAPESLAGVSRVKVSNGAPGTSPVYRFAGPEDTSFATEYEVCFKCHSSWATLPAGQPDLALLFNTNNPSFHPVEAAGRNHRIDPGSFVNGWSAGRLVYCFDCHGSDDPTTAGPHGSANRHLLKGSYTTASTPSRMTPTDACFACHSWDTYANPAASASALAASRWNPAKEPSGHAFHVGIKGYSCWACHESHGSTLNPGLIATSGRRLPGMTSYRQTPTGGQCAATCHTAIPGPHAYTVNYGR